MKPILRNRWLAVVLPLALVIGCSDGPTGSSDSGLRIEVAGLPGGTAAAISVTGPGGYTRAVTGTEELVDLSPGAYTVAAADVAAGGVTYGALKASQEVTISGNDVATLTVTYASSASGLTLRISGLPSGETGTLRVTGPDGYAKELTAGALLPALPSGTYTVHAEGVATADSTYQAKPVSQEVVVGPSLAASVDVAYHAVAKRDFNLHVEAMYLVQAVQTREGAVPLVAGRDAFARVFAVGNQTNTAMPSVRVRLYDGPTVAATFVVPASGPAVVTSVNQGNATTSWDVRIPGALIRPGLRIDAAVDPGNGVVEADEQDNAFPATGTPQSLTVHAVPPLRIRMVPIHQSSTERTGNVTAANMDRFLTLTRRLHPIDDLQVDLREPYTTRTAALDPGGNVWANVVSELEAVRVAEADAEVYYYGVVNPPYNGGGVVGIANGIPSRTSLGWDRFPDAPETMAHELGHNFGRYHAPCGGAGGSDADYPYALGLIGSFGMDVETGEIKGPNAFTDIMGYCETSWWISGYTFNHVLQYRLANDWPASASSVSTLLLWGRMDRHELVLEPAFRVQARPVIPKAGGAYRLEGLDAGGQTLFSYSFAGAETSDGPEAVRTFAFAVPIDPIRSERLFTIRLSGEGRTTSVTAAPDALPQQRGPIGPFLGTELRRENGETVALRWNDEVHSMVMVRDPASGRILSFARGGEARISSDARELELLYSDGVRSIARRVIVER